MPKTIFQSALIEWYQRHKRELPWRSTKDPYKIWLSEIILQQTRVEQGLPYYHKFVRNYPYVRDLADANEDDILKDWEGLGYYSRARNLHHASKQVAYELKGIFPDNYSEILKLKGVGEYTAAAISSFAFDAAHAVVDGNVFRVLSRYFNIATPINTTSGKKEFAALAAEMLNTQEPAIYNQAIMEFGALQCVPKNPDCHTCPLSNSCRAYALDLVGQLPVKKKKNYNRERYFNYAVIRHKDEIFIEQRLQKDIWNKLYQFVLVEASSLIRGDQLLEEIGFGNPAGLTLKNMTHLPKHKLSHQTIYIQLVEIEVPSKDIFPGRQSGKWVAKDNHSKYAFPKPLRAYLDRNN